MNEICTPHQLDDIRRRRSAPGQSEAGQTTTEYVAITAVAVALAIGVQWVVLGNGLITAIGDLTDGLTTAITAMF